MDEQKKLELINTMMGNTIGLTTSMLEQPSRTYMEIIFKHYYWLNPELEDMDAVKVSRFIQNIIDIGYVHQKDNGEYAFNETLIKVKYNNKTGK